MLRESWLHPKKISIVEKLNKVNFVIMHQPELLTRSNNIMRSDAEEFTDEFSDQLGQMDGQCIDVGTGAGDVTVDFILPKLKPNSTLLCSDISEAMVDYQRKTYGDNKRLSFRVLDIETPNLPEDLVGQFDHLTSLYCVHWCYDIRRAFENVYALLRPGGTAFMTFLADYETLDAYAAIQVIPKYASYMKEAGRLVPPFRNVDRPRQSLLNLLSDVGFYVKNCSLRRMNYIVQTVDELKAYFVSASPFDVESMPNGLKEEYVRDLVKEVTDRAIVFNKHADNEEEFSTLLKYRVFAVHLKKPLDK